MTYVDRITPVERRLYFSTANAHFKSGCPMLALEVLQKLPEVSDRIKFCLYQNQFHQNQPNRSSTKSLTNS